MFGVVLVVVVFLVSVVSYCSDLGVYLDGLFVNEMILNFVNFIDCYGVVLGNINLISDLNNLNFMWGIDF